VARGFVPNTAVAEEVVQETWIGVLKGIGRFEERSSLKTWIFRILTNQAKTRGEREARSVASDFAEASVEASRFENGMWNAGPVVIPETPDDHLLAGEVLLTVESALDELPATQRQVVTLRDVEGLSSEEVCSLLGISEGNQRVLLHRGRSKVRAALEGYFEK